jgi:hypothetical protein
MNENHSDDQIARARVLRARTSFSAKQLETRKPSALWTVANDIEPLTKKFIDSMFLKYDDLRN